MALIPTRDAPPRHFRAQSPRELREIRRRIDAAELEALGSEPAPLTADPYLLDSGPSNAYSAAKPGPRPAPQPLRLIKTEPEPAICGFGTCALSPECTRRCRYLEASQALASSTGPGLADRAPLPKANHQARRVVWIALLVYAASCVGFATWWLTT